MKAEAHTSACARDVMTSEPICAELGMTIREVGRLLEENEVSGVPVIDAQGRCVGVVSRTDLIRRYMEGDWDRDPRFLVELFSLEEEEDEEVSPMSEPVITVDEIMTEDPITAAPATPLPALAAKMVEARVHRVIIVDEAAFPVGIVTSLDLIKGMAGV